MGTRWDKMLSDAHADVAAAGQKVEQAVKNEAAVIAEHNVNTPAKVEAVVTAGAAKVGEAVKTEVNVVVEHNQGTAAKVEGVVKKDALQVLKEAEAEAEKLTNPVESAAKAIEAHAATVTGGLANALKEFAAKLRSGEETLVADVKAELAKIGVKF